MVTPENMVSVAGQHALQDMVELEMYLVVQAQKAPWPIMPRSVKRLHAGKIPYSNVVASNAANELLDRGFIEASSSRTFVVSKSGHAFYEQKMKPHFGLILSGGE